jgi:hypothetical protein
VRKGEELKMRKVLLGGVMTVVAAALAACSNDPVQPDTGEVSFAIDGDGQEVILNGSPRDPAYKAAYPLSGVDRLVVTVKQSGRLAAQCTRGGVTKTCDDTPFFAKISRTGASCAGVRTRVFDLKGTLVADVKYARFVGDDGTTHDYDPNGGSTNDGQPAGTSTGGGGTSRSGGTADGTGASSGGASSSGGTSGSSGGTSSSGGTVDGTGGSSGGASSSGGTRGSSGGTSSGGGTADGGGCTTLQACCATLKGGLNTGCARMVGIGDGSACTSILGAYQSMGYCGGTRDGSPGGGGGSSGWPGSSGGSPGSSGASSSGAGGDDGCGGTGDGSGGGGGASGGGGGASGGAPGSSGGSTPGGGSSGSSGASSGGTSGAPGSSGGGTTDCSQSDFDQARAQFCAGVNQWLKAHNLNMTVNCGQLDSTSFDVGLMYSQSAADFSCTDILEGSWQKAHDLLVWTDKCGASAETTLFNWKEEARYQLKKDGACRHSPLVLDLDGDGIALTSLERGVSFDLLATGTKVRSAWIGPGDALLAIDWNRNGAIDGAGELFGQSSFGQRFEDGFAALRELDRNGDGVVDAKDPAWVELVAWRDADKNGASVPSELVPLRFLGVTSLVVTPERTGGFDAHGNEIPLVSKFVRKDGTRAALVDAFFRFQP